MTISVFIDNNIWDWLFKHELDLSAELPTSEFALGITSEAEFEIRAIEERKPELWARIKQAQRDAGVVTDTLFGFEDPQFEVEDQRVGGWESGRWISDEEQALLASLHKRRPVAQGEPKRTTRLFRNEADLSLASRSCHSVVLTLDKKPGALKDAYELGGMILFLNDINPLTHRLSDLVRGAYSKV